MVKKFLLVWAGGGASNGEKVLVGWLVVGHLLVRLRLGL